MKKIWIVGILLMAIAAYGAERRLIGREDVNWGTGTFQDTLGTTFHQIDNSAALYMVIGDGTNAITSGVKGYVTIPFACTLKEITLLASNSGTIIIDLWKDTYANYPPTVADSIAGSVKPYLNNELKYQDATLTGWTTSLAAGDVLAFNVDYASTVSQVSIILKVQR